jgi:uncharacterized protein (TIGR02453 family)
VAELVPFTGFGPDAMGFLEGLSVDNSVSWFDAHRPTYEQQVFAPLKSLVVAVGEQLQDRVGPGIRFEPKVGKSMFRINRDLRFSKDKTPYHTHLDAVFWEGSRPRSSPGFILRIAPDEVVVGAGVFGLAGERLDRWRAAVLDDDRGPELVDVIDESRTALRGATLSEPTRKSVPRGLPADHPRADLLRRDGLHLSATVPTPALITSARFARWVVDRHAELAGLHRWLVRELGD